MSWEEAHRRAPWGTWPDEDVVRVVSRARARGRYAASTSAAATAPSTACSARRAIGQWDLTARRRRSPGCGGGKTSTAPSYPWFGPTPAGFPSGRISTCCSTSKRCATWRLRTTSRRGARWAAPSGLAGGLVMSVAFTNRCYPCDGRRSDELVLAVHDGPLAGLGPTTFLGEQVMRDRVHASGLTLVELQRRFRTVGPSHLGVEEWVVLATRASA